MTFEIRKRDGKAFRDKPHSKAWCEPDFGAYYVTLNDDDDWHELIVGWARLCIIARLGGTPIIEVMA